MSSKLELNIDRIVIEGISVDNSEQLNLFIRKELTRLIREGGLPKNWSRTIDFSRLQFNDIQISKNPKPRQMGAQIAKSIYTGLKTPQPLKNHSPS